MKYLKFIIFDGEPIFGYVENHYHLLPKNIEMNDPQIKGGGFSIDNDVCTFHGTSMDFGRFDSGLMQKYFQTKDYSKNFGFWWCIRSFKKSKVNIFKFQELDELYNVTTYGNIPAIPIDLE